MSDGFRISLSHELIQELSAVSVDRKEQTGSPVRNPDASSNDFAVSSFLENSLPVLRLGLVDDFRTFRIEQPGPEFFEFLAD